MHNFYRIKLANYHLLIAKGSYSNIPIDKRKCTLRKLNYVGGEFHYLFKCIFFTAQPATHLRRYYYTQLNMLKIVNLFEITYYTEILKVYINNCIVIHNVSTGPLSQKGCCNPMARQMVKTGNTVHC